MNNKFVSVVTPRNWGGSRFGGGVDMGFSCM